MERNKIAIMADTNPIGLESVHPRCKHRVQLDQYV